MLESTGGIWYPIYASCSFEHGWVCGEAVCVFSRSAPLPSFFQVVMHFPNPLSNNLRSRHLHAYSAFLQHFKGVVIGLKFDRNDLRIIRWTTHFFAAQ